MDIQSTVTDTAKRAAILWATKKGIQWSGSILKIGLLAGVGYYVYTLIRDYKNEKEYLEEYDEDYYGEFDV
ncbi:hypothetical protein BH23BAC2_BH23BAC2_14260 [soil metagenome]